MLFTGRREEESDVIIVRREGVLCTNSTVRPCLMACVATRAEAERVLQNCLCFCEGIEMVVGVSVGWAKTEFPSISPTVVWVPLSRTDTASHRMLISSTIILFFLCFSFF